MVEVGTVVVVVLVLVELAVVVVVDVVEPLDAATEVLAGEAATAVPFLLVAVTTTRSVEPTSVAVGR